MCLPSNFNGLLTAVMNSPCGLPFSRDTIAFPSLLRPRPSSQGTEHRWFQAAGKRGFKELHIGLCQFPTHKDVSGILKSLINLLRCPGSYAGPLFSASCIVSAALSLLGVLAPGGPARRQASLELLWLFHSPPLFFFLSFNTSHRKVRVLLGLFISITPFHGLSATSFLSWHLPGSRSCTQRPGDRSRLFS